MDYVSPEALFKYLNKLPNLESLVLLDYNDQSWVPRFFLDLLGKSCPQLSNLTIELPNMLSMTGNSFPNLKTLNFILRERYGAVL
jgi:hypothetical protein